MLLLVTIIIIMLKVQSELRIDSPLNSSDETILYYFCSTDYLSPVMVDIEINGEVYNVPCSDGNLSISAVDQCSMSTICILWNYTRICSLNCTQVPIPQFCSGRQQCMTLCIDFSFNCLLLHIQNRCIKVKLASLLEL